MRMKNIVSPMRIALLIFFAIASSTVAHAWDYFDGTYVWSFARIQFGTNTCARLEYGNKGRGVSYGTEHVNGPAYADMVEVGDAPIGSISIPTTVRINTNGRIGDTEYPVMCLPSVAD